MVIENLPVELDVTFCTDLRASRASTLTHVQPQYTIALDPRWAGAWYVLSDINQDGCQEIITARVYDKHDIHHTVSCAAYDLSGQQLWGWGDPDAGCAALHSDVACQVADMTGTGDLEVVVATDASVLMLDAASGCIVREFAIPPHASDSLYLTDLTGDGTLDIIVKDRYDALWAFDLHGTQLWHHHRPGGAKTCHHPIRIHTSHPANDRLIIGFACIDLYGNLVWDLQGKGVDDLIEHGHLDCARVIPESDHDLLMTACGANALLRVTWDGDIRWVKRGLHYESIQLAQLAGQSDLSIVVDIAHQEPDPGFLEVCDLDGKDRGRYLCLRSRQHRNVRWQSADWDDIVVAQDKMILDGISGEVLAYLETPLPPELSFDQTSRSTEHALLGDFIYKVNVADVDGDGCDEIILSTNPGNMLWIFDTPHQAKTTPVDPCGTNVTLY